MNDGEILTYFYRGYAIRENAWGLWIERGAVAVDVGSSSAEDAEALVDTMPDALPIGTLFLD
jgi:hypothetical protein